MAFIASYIMFVDYNLLHKRMRHPTSHALKQIMKRLDATFAIDKQIKLTFVKPVSLTSVISNTFPL